MGHRSSVICLILAVASWCNVVAAQEPAALRLVPFPKKVTLTNGSFLLDKTLTLEAPADSADLLGQLIGVELRRAGLAAPRVRHLESDADYFRLATGPVAERSACRFRQGATDEDYVLVVEPDGIVCGAPGPPGMCHGAQTLCQLIRANRRGNSLPTMTIEDWPSLRWRCFQDDMTRGPSSTFDTLRREVALGASFKMNLFTYYMEYQYAFKKHPIIGPENGSLEPADLKALVEFAKTYHVEILGNQQSFGHFARILQHEQYAPLRENPNILSPVKEESYQLLDDMYSEVCPLLPFDMFNVCCDETWGLGQGPSKQLADKIGVGGVYVQHVRRVHDLLKEKYKKRMMMWGDIILQHPDKLDQVPKDTVMLTWGYGPRDSFEDQIIPFARSGYEFFVCPGISNWSRILPNFGVATTNIRNFVRDGAKHGTLGMLNTAWEDDGEALQGYRWHGYAWGAECAWNASATTPEDFNRRIGAVLFGEPGDHFGRAIEALSETHRLAGMQGMNNRRFWQDDFKPVRSPRNIEAAAARLLNAVRPAIEHLEMCQEQATANKDLLAYFLFGARRMELIGQRMLDGLEAARLYTGACDSTAEQAVPLLRDLEALVEKNRQAYESLGRQFETLWLAESKPYALDWTLDRYAGMVTRYEALARQVAEAHGKAEAGQPLSPPEDLGLLMPESFARRTRPYRCVDQPLAPDAAWAEPSALHRVGVVVRAGSVDRHELPVEVALPLSAELAAKPIRAFSHKSGGPPQEIPAQLDPSEQPPRTRLTFVLPGPVAKGTEVPVHVYLGLPDAAHALPRAASTVDGPDGMKWIENDKVRLLLAPEGGHVYRWEVKGLSGRDVTMPGQTGWFGFSDLHTYRQVPHTLKCVARGPALVRYQCSTEDGLVKWISVFAGASWMEVMLSDPTSHYWNFDNPVNFAGDGPTPGAYLFSNGVTGSVSKEGPYAETQVKANNVYWSVKHNPQKLALGLTTPETRTRHVTAPGAGSGGIGIEGSTPTSHFVTFAGSLVAAPEETMNRLRQTLDLKNQPQMILYAIQSRETVE